MTKDDFENLGGDLKPVIGRSETGAGRTSATEPEATPQKLNANALFDSSSPARPSEPSVSDQFGFSELFKPKGEKFSEVPLGLLLGPPRFWTSRL